MAPAFKNSSPTSSSNYRLSSSRVLQLIRLRMSTSLNRLLSSVTNLSAANPALHCTRSLPPTRSAFDSVTRFICSSTQRSLSHSENPVEEKADAPKENLPPADTQSQEDEVDDDDDGHVNKETGEIGGPKGPEPTRYGDWERNGRCYDF